MLQWEFLPKCFHELQDWELSIFDTWTKNQIKLNKVRVTKSDKDKYELKWIEIVIPRLLFWLLLRKLTRRIGGVQRYRVQWQDAFHWRGLKLARDMGRNTAKVTQKVLLSDCWQHSSIVQMSLVSHSRSMDELLSATKCVIVSFKPPPRTGCSGAKLAWWSSCRVAKPEAAPKRRPKAVPPNQPNYNTVAIHTTSRIYRLQCLQPCCPANQRHIPPPETAAERCPQPSCR